MKINTIITGVTGMVGEGVLIECLQHPEVESVLVINRKPCGVSHPKLKEIIHADFFDISPIEEQLKGYNACYFCLGVTSLGKNEETYYRYSYTLTMHVAEKLVKHNPEMNFCYVSGAGTDSSEKGRLMWARIKGKTENDLMKLPFKRVYAFRPGAIKATQGQKNTPKAYKYLSWLFPVLKLVFPNGICTLKQIGQAMINVTLNGYKTPIIEVKDIVVLSEQ